MHDHAYACLGCMLKAYGTTFKGRLHRWKAGHRRARFSSVPGSPARRRARDRLDYQLAQKQARTRTPRRRTRRQ